MPLLLSVSYGWRHNITHNIACFIQFVPAGYLSFGPMAQCVVHALKKAWRSRARFTLASSLASHCKQCSALTSPALHARN